MSETIVQKVGLAAYNAAENGFRKYDPEKEDIQDYLRAKLDFIGRAAIAAMRTPTEVMVNAGRDHLADQMGSDGGVSISAADGILTAAIDAALKE